MTTITLPPPADSTLPPLHIRRAAFEPVDFLPFDDDLDLEDALRGFVAAPGYHQILAGEGETAWRVEGADWMLDDPDRLDPELRRRVALNLSYGLYEVLEGRIYQVRGFDLANMTFVRGDTGWIVFDPLTLRETSSAALALVCEHVADLPVVAVVYSHGEPDDEGGARGLVEVADLDREGVHVIAPVGYAEFEQPGQGPAIGAGPLPVTISIGDAGQELTIDGVSMVFSPTVCGPGPTELDVSLPDFKAMRVSARVDEVDDTGSSDAAAPPMAWPDEFAAPASSSDVETEVIFAAHDWPRWDADRIQAILRSPAVPC
jgi:alkyl sulfatase BDS1-like metallo-beta-lactamase superfamily hydrolase